jgi:peptide/nickel transport system permease protein
MDTVETVAPTPVPPTVAGTQTERRQARRENWRLLRRRPAFIIGVVVLAFWVVCAVLERRITPYDPFNYTTTSKLSPRRDHWFGTDKIGRDIFSRVIAGARDVMLVAPSAAVLGVFLGAILGMLMGYYRGRFDLIVSRLVDALLSIPVLLVGLLVLTLARQSPFLRTVTFGSNRLLLIYVVGLLFMPIVARTVRSAVLSEREQDYITSAALRGESSAFIMTREILPNVMPPIIVELTVRIGYAIFTVATLSFLGVGIQRPSADWGLAISEGRDLLRADIWWPVTFPALAIASLVIAVNLIADSIQAVFNQ